MALGQQARCEPGADEPSAAGDQDLLGNVVNLTFRPPLLEVIGMRNFTPAGLSIVPGPLPRAHRCAGVGRVTRVTGAWCRATVSRWSGAWAGQLGQKYRY